MIDDFATFAADLEKLPGKVVRQGRGMTARRLDRAAEDAKQKALATWTVYGRGLAGSAGTIRARMSRSREIVGYVFADGEGAYRQEHGTGHHPPKPVLQGAVENQLAGWADELGRIASDL